MRHGVAIPARDEEERIADCLRALAGQRPALPGVCVLVVNNSRDATAARARALGLPPPWTLVVDEVELPPGLAHAGGARRAAMERVRALAGPGTLIVTTDADGRAAPDWLALIHQAHRRHGAQAVAGRVEGDPGELAALAPAALAAGQREGEYALLAARLETLLDPLPHDPWPRHPQASGANLSCTRAAWDRVGGLPPASVGEDRAFVERLKVAGLAVRHDPLPLVTVSARLDGRAPGGMATTLARLGGADYRCDRALAPADVLAERLRLKGAARRAHAAGALADWLQARGWPRISGLADSSSFERAWRRLETRPGLLPPLRRLRPCDLARETARMELLLEGALPWAA